MVVVKALPRIALLLLLSLLAACAKPVPEDYRDYIGHWRGDGMRLVIRADGHADYDRVQDRSQVSIQRLNELFAGTGQVGFRAFKRLDGHLVDTNAAIKVVQHA